MMTTSTTSARYIAPGLRYISARKGAWWITVEQVNVGPKYVTVHGINGFGESVTERYAHKEILEIIKD